MFGEELREARKARGLTQRGLADELEVTQPVVSRWERGRSRPSPAQAEAIHRILGVSAPSRPITANPSFRPLPERATDRLPIPLERRVWQRSELTGDIQLIASLAKEDVLLAILDTVGRGQAAALAAHHLRGWLHGWIASRRVAVRLDELVQDLLRELRDSRLDATWFLAMVGRAEGPHAVNLHLASHAFPAPLLFSGPQMKTLATLPSEDPGQGSTEVSYVRHDELEAPWKLVLATDGLLARLGAGDERRGKKSVRRWLSGAGREIPPERRLRGGEAGDDETFVELCWSDWDDEFEFDVSDSDARHDLLRTLGRSARKHWKDDRIADRTVVATSEALSNVARHAYSTSGPARVRWRHTRTWTQVEISDEGVGGPIEESTGYFVMRRQADVVDHWERHPSGMAVLLALNGLEKDAVE